MNHTPVDHDTRLFIDRLGLRFEAEGVARIAGQALGLLLITREPLSLDEIAALLCVSKASASSNGRYLERMGLVVRSARPGDRRDYYRVADDLPTRMIEFWVRVVRETSEVIANGENTPAAADPVIRERLGGVVAALVGAIDDLSARVESTRVRKNEQNGALRRVG